MDSQSDENFETFRKHILPRTSNKGALFCGSFYELPLEYALLNLTDLDHLSFDRTLIAASETADVSKYFNEEILTIETKNCRLGFARLLRRSEDITEYYALNRKSLQGPAIKKRLVTWSEVSNIFCAASRIEPNLKAFVEFNVDFVYAVLCPYWPPEADEWRIRKRISGWPTTDLIDKIVADGCHLVPKSHHSNPNDDTSWRFSFSQAELLLISSWNEVQNYIYHALRLLKSDVIAKCGGEKKTFLCTYYFKTLMLWACEEKPSSFWGEDRIEAATEELLLQMIQWLIDRNCPNYFIRENNMIDHLQTDFDVSIEVLLLHAARQTISTVIALQPKVYRGKFFRVRISDKALLLIQLAINRRFLINALARKRERYVVKNLSASGLLRCEVEHLFGGLQLHRLLMSDLSSSDAEIRDRAKAYETNALSHFQINFNRKSNRNYSYVYISSSDSLSCTMNMFLKEAPDQHNQRICCYSRADKGNLAKKATEALCQSMLVTIDNNHFAPSFLISAAYYANFYYTRLQDYRQALKICEEALTTFRKLENVVSLNTFEAGFSDEVLCVFINRRYIEIFDAGIQVVFGFLSLRMNYIQQIDKSKISSARQWLIRDFVLQVCPALLLEYIRIRCRNQLHLNQSDCLDAMTFLYDNDSEKDTALRRLSNATLFAAIRVKETVLIHKRGVGSE